jgi:two-component system, LuxR family, response regulator FixJ
LHIYIIDEDPDLPASLSLSFRRDGHVVRAFPSGGAFLDKAEELSPGCVLLDFKLEEYDGLEVQQRLGELDTDHAVVLLTSEGGIPEVVSAMRAGAVDVLRKPFLREELAAALARAATRIEESLFDRAERAKRAAVSTLSAREREVLRALATGKPSKVVAHEMGLSPRTIDMHRARILKRLDVANIGAALVLAKDAGLI